MTSGHGVAGALWQAQSRVSAGSVPDEVETVAGHCLLDWLGCAIAGSREPLSEILRAEFAQAQGPARLLGTDQRAGVLAAALVNGAAGHALDYDDTGGIGHPSAPLWPVVLAVAEEQSASGAQARNAFIAGYEVETRIAQIFGSGPYGAGWHTTSLYGVFGAMAAAAHLLQLDEPAFGCALGLAASQASGLKANFGTMTKPFHAGHAAERGLLAARLAARGYTANPEALEGNQGLLQALGCERDAIERLEAVADRWFVPDTLFKHHAACYLTHATINNVRSVAAELAPEAVTSMTLTVNPSILDVCGLYDQPRTGLEGKFSLKGTAAMALHGIDTADPGSYCEAVLCEPVLQQSMAKVQLETDPGLTVMQSALALATSDGAEHRAHADSGTPNRDLPQQAGQLRRKFAALVGGGADSESLTQSLLNLGGAASIAQLLGTLPTHD
ncbi:MAG: MmgE/PrpD family protein [Pseudomonadota bacterium]